MGLYQWASGDRITADRLNRVYNLLKGVGGGTDSITLISGTTVDMSAMSATGGLKLPTAAGAVPTTAGILAYDSTANAVVFGNGTTTRTWLTDPTTTRGDTVYRNAGGLTRLAVGGAYLTVVSDGTDPVYGPPGQFKRKTSDESVTSSTTLQDDNDLVLAITANAVWVFDGVLLVDGATAGDIKVAFTVPAAATLAWGGIGSDTGAAAPSAVSVNVSVVEASGTANAYGVNGTGNLAVIFLKGYVANGANAGNITLQWAQNASSGTATTVHAGSWLAGYRIS